MGSAPSGFLASSDMVMLLLVSGDGGERVVYIPLQQ
jgi:hypothetical protein